MGTNIYGLRGIDTNLLSSLGNVNIKSSMYKFQDDLKVLLETKRKTLIGDPAFGSDLVDLLYEPANETTASLIRQEVANTIEKYYKNINITQVDVTFTSHTVKLKIYYHLMSSNIDDTVMLEFIRADYV